MFDASKVQLNQNKGNDEFFTLDYILTKKHPKNLFGFYKKREDYHFKNYILKGVVFDMSEIGEDPIKLVRSILIQYKLEYLIPINEDSYTSQRSSSSIINDYFRDLKLNINVSHYVVKAGLVHLLLYHEDNKKRYDITMNILAAYLGAQYNNDTYIATSSSHYVPTNKENLIDFDEAVRQYYNNLDEIIIYINEALHESKNIKNKCERKKKEKFDVEYFLEYFCGFKTNEINYFLDKATKNRVPIKLSQFFRPVNTPILDCIPRELQDDVQNIIRNNVIHPNAKRVACLKCWIQTKHELREQKCFTHSIGKKLNMIASSAQLNHDHLETKPSAPHIEELKSIDCEKKESDLICDVCMERNKDHALVPCGHLYCLTCIKKVDKCPECRDVYKSVLKIFV